MQSEAIENIPHRDAVHPATATTPERWIRTAVYLPLDEIRRDPNQPRKYLTAQDIEWLTESIAEKGVLQPILVRRVEDGTYMIIAGERRFKAASEAGLTHIPSLVITRADGQPPSDADVLHLALVENLQRRDLSDYDLAMGVIEALRQELAFDSQDEVVRFLRRMYNKTLRPGEEEQAKVVEAAFRQLGRNWRSFATNQLNVFSLSDGLQTLLRLRRLDLSKARIINRIKDRKTQATFVDMATQGKWTTAILRREVKDYLEAEVATMEDEIRRAGIAKRLTEFRQRYVKHRRKIPLDTIAEIESLLQRLGDIVTSSTDPEAPSGSS